MLRLVFGKTPEDKLEYYSREIKRLLSSGENAHGIICIVPDQFSFEFDKRLYCELGPKEFNLVRISSFKKLAEELIVSYGTDKGVLIKKAERLSLMFLSVRRAIKEKGLTALDRAAKRPSFIGEMSEIIDGLIRSGATSELLEGYLSRLEGTLRDKLSDIAAIYGFYIQELKSRGLRDESSLVGIGAELSQRHDFFRGSHVFIDRFDSYSKDELDFIKRMLSSAAAVTVSLNLPKDLKPQGASVYSTVYSTKKRLLQAAEELGAFCEQLEISEEAPRAEGIRSVESVMLRKRQTGPSCEGVEIIHAKTVYEEAELCAAAARALISEGVCGCTDIAVIVRDVDSYMGALESAFERYGLPYFIDWKSRACDASAMVFIFMAIEAAASRRPNTERLLGLLRSPFSGFTEEEIILLEEYAVRWNIDGDVWLSDFSADWEKVSLEELNRIRRRLVEPVKRLHDACSGAEAAQICLAFNAFLKEWDFPGNAHRLIMESPDEGERLEAARLFKQVWTVLMEGISSIYTIAGSQRLSLTAFLELLRVIMSQLTISSPPQKLSAISVYDASRSVIPSVKTAFVLGLNERKFPMDIKRTGILSGSDTETLKKNGIVFELSQLERLDAERLYCFKALTAPRDRLVLSYTLSDSLGNRQRPSQAVRRIISSLGIAPKDAELLPRELYLSTPRAAYYHLTASGMDKGARLSVIKALMTLPEYEKRLAQAAGQSRVRSLEPEIADRLFTSDGSDINITASRVDLYNKCPYEYFLKYGLKLKTVRPLGIDPANRGSVMHFVFERMLSSHKEDFTSLSDGELSLGIDGCLREYRELYLGGDFGKTPGFEAVYSRLRIPCLEILINLREELKLSSFKPVRFEYDLSGGGRSILRLPLKGDGGRERYVSIRGIVDRIDVSTDLDGTEYIRIIDYKTGGKSLKWEELYNGLDLQMLIYMSALTRGSDTEFNKMSPSGVLYMNSGFLSCKDDYDPETSLLTRQQRSFKQLRRSGLIVDDGFSPYAMDSSLSGVFAPVTMTKSGELSGSCLIPKGSFLLLEDFALEKLREFGSGLVGGRISPMPVGKGGRSECSFCEYSDCCNHRRQSFRELDSEDKYRLLELIELDNGKKEDKDA